MVSTSSKVAFITGAGRGLGRSTALELARNGWDLALLARTQSDLERVAEEARRFGRRAWPVSAPVDDAARVAAAFLEFDRVFDHLDALITCAGTGSFAPAAATAPEEWDRIMRVNLSGTFYCCREAIRRMLPRGCGHIVNVLSIAAKMPFPGASAYCASKWGALGLTRVLAEEVRRDGIVVSAICPGSIDTPFWDGISHNLDVKDMLSSEDVAASICFVLDQPKSIRTDEWVLTPPKGIL